VQIVLGLSSLQAGAGSIPPTIVFMCIGTAMYRSRVESQIPAEVPSEASEAAGTPLGGAVAASAGLPVNLGASLQNVASLAFVDAFQAVAVFSAAVLFAVAVVVGIVLRDVAVGRGTAATAGCPNGSRKPMRS